MSALLLILLVLPDPSAFPVMHVRLSLACARIPIAASVSEYLSGLPLALPHPAYLNRLCLLAARTFNFSVLFNS